MRKIFRPLIPLLLASTISTVYAQTDLRLAIDLVKAARFDFAFLTGAQLALQRDAEEGKAPKDKSDCFSQQKPSELTEPMAAYLASQLTDQELKTALSFYLSPLGRKYTQYGIVSFYKNYRFETVDQLPAFSNQEMAEIAAFSKTAVGDKLFYKQLVRSSIKSEPLARVWTKLRRACGLQ